MPRLLLHPGFHKTGTSSAQHLLWRNRALLAPHVTIYQLRHLRDAAKLCMGFSRTGNPLLLLDLVEALNAALVETPEDKHILLTCEGLSGHLPGWPGVADYGAARIAASYLTGYLAERFPGHVPTLIYTTRAPESWLWSAWRHHLIGQRLTAGWDEFAETLRGAADLTAVAAEIAGALDPLPVQTLPLEEAQTDPRGPGGALLTPLGLPPELTEALVPVGHGNRGPDAALAEALLALNRSDLGDAALRERKLALCEAAGVGGWARGMA
ncbi:hypothetical protein [Roseisalinus antarcticus]|uniref:Sulfotransferase family protein n=1 Tax=Roseisalinus antarcticus TaxID=254357 RepID=A0A1Y5SBY9_9RHOB|nr:hypothetical protein [Roseisalinus antarcticus]SLN37128.1 hypothetical protein ROA7023_01377 [Roseisalinus antarcticus]